MNFVSTNVLIKLLIMFILRFNLHRFGELSFIFILFKENIFPTEGKVCSPSELKMNSFSLSCFASFSVWTFFYSQMEFFVRIVDLFLFTSVQSKRIIFLCVTSHKSVIMTCKRYIAKKRQDFSPLAFART